jgi:hypothetical protein
MDNHGLASGQRLIRARGTSGIGSQSNGRQTKVLSMTLTVELPASVEQRVRQRAAAVGYAPEAIIAELVQDHFSAAATVPDALTEEETRWLKQATEVPRPGVRERWRELDRLRRTDSLNPSQQAEMVKLYDEIETNHARRIEAAVELARRWQVSLDSMMDQLGLSPPADDDNSTD